jgi:hypothetical protein
MTDKINGRTPEEIYKALRCVITQINDDCEDTCDSCKNCPNNFDGGRRELAVYLADAIVRIQQLERERDAAVAEFTEFANSVAICVFCKDFKFDEPCDKGINGEDC